MSTICYIFKGNRKDNFNNKTVEAKDFYYGVHYFKSLGNSIEIIELDNSFPSKFSPFKLLDKVFNKLTNLPFFMSKLVNMKNIKIMIKSDVIFIVNESVAFSSLPVLLLLKILKRKGINLFLMGILSIESKNKGYKILKKNFINLLFYCSSNLYFLSKAEKEFAIKEYPKQKNKMKFVPFSTDYEFWSEENLDIERSGILFVGNDKNRDYSLLLEIAKELQYIDFTFLTQQITPEMEYKNIKIIQGHLHKKILTDSNLRDLYNSSRLLILPLKESLQPSGQSVALQSMSCKTPVMISNTSGFWDKDRFSDLENIFFVEPNDLSTWKSLISKYYDEKSLLKKVGENSKKTVESYYGANLFFDILYRDNLEYL